MFLFLSITKIFYMNISEADLESWVFRSWEELTAAISFVKRCSFSVMLPSISVCWVENLIVKELWTHAERECASFLIWAFLLNRKICGFSMLVKRNEISSFRKRGMWFSTEWIIKIWNWTHFCLGHFSVAAWEDGVTSEWFGSFVSIT